MRRFLSVALVSGLVFGCGDSFTMDGVSGAYKLQSFNGQDIPVTVALAQGSTITIDSISTTLTAAGTWSSTLSRTIRYQDGTADTQTETDSGTFTLVEPSTIRFTDGETFNVLWDGNTFTLTELAGTAVYRK